MHRREARAALGTPRVARERTAAGERSERRPEGAAHEPRIQMLDHEARRTPTGPVERHENRTVEVSRRRRDRLPESRARRGDGNRSGPLFEEVRKKIGLRAEHMLRTRSNRRPAGDPTVRAAGLTISSGTWHTHFRKLAPRGIHSAP